MLIRREELGIGMQQLVTQLPRHLIVKVNSPFAHLAHRGCLSSE